jgi:tetratricopeptide (TPR) repeat protein
MAIFKKKRADACIKQGNDSFIVGQYDEAAVAYEKAVEINPDDASAHFNLAITYDNLARYAEAVEAYKKAVTLAPDNANAFCGMGYAHLNLGQYDHAVAACENAVSIKPDYALAYYDMGKALAAMERHADAVIAYEKAIDVKFDYALAYYELGLALNELQRYTEAIIAFKRSVAAKPATDSYYRRLSDADPIFEWKDDIAPYKKPVAVKADPSDSHLGMALSYCRLEQFDQAVDALKTALELEPENVLAHCRLAETYERLNEDTKALVAYNMVVSLEQSGPHADTAKQRIAELS